MPRELNTWAEIATYLAVSIRQAQYLEKRSALPVRRVPGERGRVVAYTNDIDDWKRRRLAPPIDAAPAAPVPASGGKRRRWRLASLAAASTLCLLVLGVYGFENLQRDEPNSFRVAGKVLTVFGQSGQPLWRYSFPSRARERDYIEHPDFCMFSDLEGDGSLETFCIFRPLDRDAVGDRLYCFDARGRVRFTFVPGRTVRVGTQDFRPPYSVRKFLVFSRGRAGQRGIVVSSTHNWSHPDQVAILDAQGRLLSEYWHHGHLLSIAFTDIDSDGVPEMLLGGVDDSPGIKRATIVVLDPGRVWGSSTQVNGAPDFDGMKTRCEKRIVYFPRTRFSQHEDFNLVTGLEVSGNSNIRAVVAEGASTGAPYSIYLFGPRLQSPTIVFSDPLKTEYRKLYGDSAGLKFVDNEIARMQQEIATRP